MACTNCYHCRELDELKTVARRMILATDTLDENDARLELEDSIVGLAPATTKEPT